jgi:hypothetical protein
MTAKEKAIELYYRYETLGKDFTRGVSMKEFAKLSALIAVDEIINSRPLEPNNADWDDCGATHKYWYDAQKEEALKYWQEVKQLFEEI